MKQTIFLGSDHGGFELKEHIKKFLKADTSIVIQDLGTDSEKSVDYPDIAKYVCEKIINEKDALGILCCGTGIGISMKANRYKSIRAAVVYDEETAMMTKKHNNANVLCLGGRTTDFKTAKLLINKWLTTDFEAGRHQRRIDKLDQ